MNARFLTLVCAGAFTMASGSLPAQTLLPPRSVSTSRQFIVYAADAELRGVLAGISEDAKAKALRILGMADHWKTPVILYVQYPQANLPELPVQRLRISQTGFGLKLQLDLVVDRSVNAADIERELLRAVFTEMIYRQAPDAAPGTVSVLPPDWLVEGTLALAAIADPAVADDLSMAAAKKHVVPVSDFLRQRVSLLDSPSRSLYRARAAGFLSMLLDQPDGRGRLARYVSSLREVPADEIAGLTTFFPDVGEEQLQKAWALSIARLSAAGGYRLLDVAASESQLAETLRIDLSKGGEPTVYGIEDYSEFVRKPAGVAALRRLEGRLLLLSAKVHPLYRPIISDYHAIAAALIKGKVRSVSPRLVRLRTLREQISRHFNTMTDYMNWFEATQAQRDSGVFASYLEAADASADDRPRRRDRVSVYLDALEEQIRDGMK